jgi:hypothetical protein
MSKKSRVAVALALLNVAILVFGLVTIPKRTLDPECQKVFQDRDAYDKNWAKAMRCNFAKESVAKDNEKLRATYYIKIAFLGAITITLSVILFAAYIYAGRVKEGLRVILTGGGRWQPWERAFWVVSLLGCVIWLVTGAVKEFALFEPKARLPTIQEAIQYSNFEDFVSGVTAAGTDKMIASLVFAVARIENARIDAYNKEVDDWNEGQWERYATFWVGYVVLYITFLGVYLQLAAEFRSREG